MFLSRRVRVAGFRSKNPMMTFWLSLLMSALFGSIVIASSLASAWRISKDTHKNK
jgi:hypothetical protein